MADLNALAEAVIKGDQNAASLLTQQALDDGSPPGDVLEKGLIAGLTVGGVIAFEALFAGPISGASMNPTRSLAPAMVSLNFDHLWVYLTAPIIGAQLAVLGCRCTQGGDCCSAGDACAPADDPAA